MKRNIVVYSGLLAILIISLKVFEYQFINRNISTEVYLGVSISIALLLGLWLGREFFIRKKKGDIRNYGSKINPEALLNYGLSKREVEVIELIEKGLTNQKIADRLFVSLSTVKTHVFNIYTKLEVKNRVQAIAKVKAISENP